MGWPHLLTWMSRRGLQTRSNLSSMGSGKAADTSAAVRLPACAGERSGLATERPPACPALPRGEWGQAVVCRRMKAMPRQQGEARQWRPHHTSMASAGVEQAGKTANLRQEVKAWLEGIPGSSMGGAFPCPDRASRWTPWHGRHRPLHSHPGDETHVHAYKGSHAGTSDLTHRLSVWP